MWNDTDIPLAHLITFRSYGSWLHGDNRGSIDRYHNHYQSAYALPNQNRYEHNKSLLKHEPVILNATLRSSVETAIRETCALRKWLLRAMSARTNHVHIVVSIGDKNRILRLTRSKQMLPGK